MNVKTQGSRSVDWIKWLIVIVIVIGSVVANIHFSAVSVYLRLVVAIVAALVAIFVAFQTRKGKYAWQYLKKAQDEIRMVVWPTRQTTVQMALIVAVMAIVAAVIILIFDQIFMWLIAWVTGQRG